MNYNVKRTLPDKQKAVIKSISDLLDVLVEIGDGSGDSDSIILDDGTEMILSLRKYEDNIVRTISIRKQDLKYTIIEETHWKPLYQPKPRQ